MPTNANDVPDFDELYARFAPQLARVLGACVQAPPWVLDDARQIAWEAYLARPGAVGEEHLLGWLATTARREALRLLRRSAREQPLPVRDSAQVPGLPSGDCGAAPVPLPTAAVAELRVRLLELDRLPHRQRRLLWLQAAGFRYAEIAARTGESERTVERQLQRARRRLSLAEAA